MLKIGSVIDGKYKILSQIGHGGMSNVYLAINEKANKPWAVKEVRKSPDKDPAVSQQSLIMETALLKKLKHSNLPSIVDVIDSDENFLIVMDYIEGNTLDRLLAEEGAQPQEDVVRWAIQLCDVLEYLHTRPAPVIYRDMKPSNIMLRSDGTVVLIDFGTAREFKEKGAADTISLGTRGYAAPEQFGRGGQTDARTDIYSLGVTVYHLVTGHDPSGPPYEMYPLTRWDPALSTGLERIVRKCTQNDPDDRYQTAGELRDALEHYHDLEDAVQRRYRRRIGLFSIVAGFSVLCAAGGAFFAIAAGRAQASEYQHRLDIASITADPLEACRMYLGAAAIDDGRSEAYQGFYEKALEDGVFSDDEEEIFQKFCIGPQQHLERFAQKDKAGYADLCYEIGNAYWYHYEHEENRQSRAVGWFQAAMGAYEGDGGKHAEYKRCSLYVQIGAFYKNVIASQIDGTDAGMYGEHWRGLAELKALDDREPDREFITLRIYREIATRVVEYARYLEEDGVTEQEILAMLAQIEQAMQQMEQGATGAVREEIGDIRWIIDGAYKMVRSTYRPS